jgi:uncharacterized membrane protein YhaH (DUF805 family)
MTDSARMIDPNRPWIRDPLDDPRGMSWVQTLFNPLGQSSRLHFTRAWTVMFMGRLLLYILPLVMLGLAGVAGVNTAEFVKPQSLVLISVPLMFVPFAIYTLLTEYTSFVAHTRRLSQARRPAFLALLVLLPLALGLGAYTAGAIAGSAQYKAMMERAAAARTGDGAEAGASGSAQRPRPPARQGQARRGPPPGASGGRPGDASRPPPSERQMAMQTGMAFGFPVWALGSFMVMLWTLLYVSRLPNDGSRRLSSDPDSD